MTTRSRKAWKLDSQGQYPRQLGWKLNGNGKLVQHKFRLGSDLREAKRREQKLQEFWERIVTTTSITPAVWNFFTLAVAKQVAKGKIQIEIPRKPHDSPDEYARYVHRVQRHYPVISFVAEDENAYVAGASSNRSKAQIEIDKISQFHLRKGNLGELDLASNDGTLHEALRGYIRWIEKDYYRPELKGITANGRTKIRQVQTLLDRHENVTLAQIDYDAVEQMIRFWRQRPNKKGADCPISRKSAQNYIGELKRFFQWLHKSKDYDWRKPEDFQEIKADVDAVPTDQQRKLAQVDTFALDELVLLNRYATPLERVFLLLGINCGFGAAEIASLQVGEVVLFRGHDERHQESFGYRTTNADSFIKRIRRKNGVYGEHLLFPQTVEAMQWALKRRRDQSTPGPDDALLLSDKGRRYDHPTKSGNRNQDIPNRLDALITRVQKDYADFSRHSFGKLRKTAGDLIRRFAGGEIQGVFLCHGQSVRTDDLADLYSNRPFGKVFEAIREVQLYLQPVFEAAGATPFVADPKAYTSRKTKDRILRLHEEGLSIRQIAETVKKSRTMVHRHLQRTAPRGER